MFLGSRDSSYLHKKNSPSQFHISFLSLEKPVEVCFDWDLALQQF